LEAVYISQIPFQNQHLIFYINNIRKLEAERVKLYIIDELKPYKKIDFSIYKNTI